MFFDKHLFSFCSAAQLRALLGAARLTGGGGLLELELRAAAPLPLGMAVFGMLPSPISHTMAADMYGVQGGLFQDFGSLEKLVVVGQPAGVDLLAEVLAAPLPSLRQLHVGMAGGVPAKALRGLVDRFAPAGVVVHVVKDA